MKPTLDYCYHTHTTRCGHAYGTDEAYVLAALQQSYRVLGFSDHAFFPGLSQHGIRGDYEQLAEYSGSIRNLQQKYRTDIDIYLAFEAEYTPFYETYYQTLLTKHGFDYLILGHHFEFNGNKILSYYGQTSDPNKIRQYGNEIAKALSTGFFSYVAHPDLYMMGYHHGWDEHAQETAKTIITASLKYDKPLELNLGGIRGRGMMTIGKEKRYPYPYEPFWKMVSQHHAKVIIGVDAHSPKDFGSGHEQVVFDIIAKYHLHVVDRLPIHK